MTNTNQTPQFSYPAPTKQWDQVAVDEAVRTQIACFGRVSYGVKGTKTNKKVALKAAALDRSLNAAFKGEGTHNHKFIDTNMDVSWYPVTADPMDALINDETDGERMAATIATAKEALTTEQWDLVMAKASGKTQKEIAEMTGVSCNAISLRWKTIVKRATRATGCAFVA